MIQFENVSFAYSGQTDEGLKDFNLTIGDGECVLFCGRSGCGKTTVTRLVNGVIPYFFIGELKGRIMVNGLDIAGLPMYEIAEKVGSVFQNPRTQFFNVDAGSEIAFGLENEGMEPEELRQRVAQSTRELGIGQLLGRNIFELSGGEKQKIAFASVYAMNPEVFLLDEPSSNLDMASIEELRRLLHLIKRQGKTILIAEHRLYYLTDLADRIVYLDQGKISEIYTPQEFLKLSRSRREAMGLRMLSLDTVRPDIPGRPKTKPVLELRNVTVRHKKLRILENICLSVSAGEIIGVAGNNGAGKTTFSKALCGLHQDCEGAILWKGTEQSRKDRLKSSYLVMQDVNYQLFAESVIKECIFGLKSPDEKLAAAALEELGLTPFGSRHPNTLSGGQKQRLAVAVSIVSGKEVLVFDEPTSGLDYDSMVRVARLLEELAQRGKVVFVITHDYELVCRVCSRVLHFDGGEMPDDLEVSADNEKRLRALFGMDKGKE